MGHVDSLRYRIEQLKISQALKYRSWIRSLFFRFNHRVGFYHHFKKAHFDLSDVNICESLFVWYILGGTIMFPSYWISWNRTTSWRASYCPLLQFYTIQYYKIDYICHTMSYHTISLHITPLYALQYDKHKTILPTPSSSSSFPSSPSTPRSNYSIPHQLTRALDNGHYK